MQWSDRIKLWFRRRTLFRTSCWQRLESGHRLQLSFQFRRNVVGRVLVVRRYVRAAPTIPCRAIHPWISMWACRGRYRRRPTSWRQEQRRKRSNSKRQFNVSGVFKFQLSIVSKRKCFMSQWIVGSERLQWKRLSADANELWSIRRRYLQRRFLCCWTLRQARFAINRRFCRCFVGRWIRRSNIVSFPWIEKGKEESVAIA